MDTHTELEKLETLLTYDGVHRATGLPLGTLYSLVARSEIPHVRLGRRLVRFRESELAAWLRQRSVGHAG